jgi:predicted RecB family nuclease
MTASLAPQSLHPLESNPSLILLDSHAARSCPVKTQMFFNKDTRLNAEITIDGFEDADEALSDLFHGKQRLLAAVRDRLSNDDQGVVDLRHIHPGIDRQVATQSAVDVGKHVIIAPELPPDLVGHRIGSPDLLVRYVDREPGMPGYLPLLVTRHHVLAPTRRRGASVYISTLGTTSGTGFFSIDGVARRPTTDPELLELAHFWRMLENLDWASGADPFGGLIGSDMLRALGQDSDGVPTDWQLRNGADLGAEPVVCWTSLAEKSIRTYSRTNAGFKLHSPLQRYDHEFKFRLSVADRTLAHNADPSVDLMVFPIHTPECEDCTWWTTCAPLIDDDDLSLRIDKAPLDSVEVRVLRDHGIATIEDLAGADLDALLPDYLARAGHRPGAESRLRLAAHRSEMILRGVELERINDDPIQIPEGNVEIDFDIETCREGEVYLWGFLVHDRRSAAPPEYVSFVRFEPMNAVGELSLAIEALSWLANQFVKNPNLRVFHYSDFEPTKIRQFLALLPEATSKILETHMGNFCDLFDVVRRHFFGLHGLGLKNVARVATGFEWHDDEPGGLNSQFWFDDAVFSPDETVRAESAQRILQYNEDDVRATQVLRQWLRNEATA